MISFPFRSFPVRDDYGCLEGLYDGTAKIIRPWPNLDYRNGWIVDGLKGTKQGNCAALSDDYRHDLEKWLRDKHGAQIDELMAKADKAEGHAS